MATITDSIGRVLAGRYRVESALGTGASAHVYAAWDVTLHRRVAIKVLHPALAEDGSFLRRFRAEAQASASLAHPHVLAVFDWGQDENGGPFVVLEHLGGGSLRDFLDAGRRLTVPQAVSVGQQAAEGLAYAHGRGFIHRDVKPANLVFDEDGRLRVADFGLARALAEAAWTEPAGALLGTARYVAPEQAEGKPVDGRTDVYALALVLYESVTGIVPFAGDTTVATIMARVGAPLPGHDALGSLSGLLTEAAAPHRQERLDAAEFAQRLADLAGTLPDPEPLSLVGPSGRGVSAREAPPADATELGRPAQGARSNAAAPGDVLAIAEAVGVATAPSGERAAKRTARARGPLPRHAPVGRHGQRRPEVPTATRRWPWIFVALVVVVLLGAGFLFALREKLFVASHPLPVIVGDSTARATTVLRADHLTLVVQGHENSITAPKGTVLREIPGSGTAIKEGSTVHVIVSSGPPPVAIPSLSAQTGGCAAIDSLFADVHLSAACSTATSTTVAAGAVIPPVPTGTAPYGSTVPVVVSSGLPDESVPNLDGMTCEGATTALAAAHLQANCTQAYTSSGIQSGNVTGWSPKTTAPYGSTVAVTISEGPPPVTVPNLTDDTVEQAEAALQGAGLVPGQDFGPVLGKVFNSSPAMGTTVPDGSTVNLYTQ
jgi:serine/threonine-protein kinase